MPRSGSEARRRLQQATLELFLERGYDATTTAGIAARAGVTERTFFRHFSDKREALFEGEEAFRDALVQGVLSAPEGDRPLTALISAFRAVETMLRENRSFSEPRHKLIAKTPALQERVLTKTAMLTAALAAALRRRSVSEPAATLAAEVGMTIFGHAVNLWMTDPTADLNESLARTLAEVHEVTAIR